MPHCDIMGVPNRGTYMLQWLGAIKYPTRERETSTIEALYTRMKPLDAYYARGMSPGPRTFLANVPVTLLRLLKIGSTFTDRHLSRHFCRHEAITFPATEGRQQVISADATDAYGNRILPFITVAPTSLSHSRLLSYDISAQGPRVLIPCWEIMRYFYCPDGAFARDAIEGRFLSSPPFSRKGYGFNGRRFIFPVGTTPATRHDVASAKFALNQARLIYARSIGFYQIEQHNILEALPPFTAPWSAFCRVVRLICAGILRHEHL